MVLSDTECYILVDCIDNAYSVECFKIHDIKNYRSSFLFNGASVSVTGDNEYALSLCRNKPSYPLSDIAIGTWLRYRYIITDQPVKPDRMYKEGYSDNTILVLPYGASTNLAGFQYIYDIDLLNALTGGHDFVIARLNSLLVYTNGSLDILPYGFNWFAQQLVGKVQERIEQSIDYGDFREKLLSYITDMYNTINANVTNDMLNDIMNDMLNDMMDLDQPDEFRYTISTISGMVNLTSQLSQTSRAGFAPRSERGNRVRNLLQRKVRRSINSMDSITDYMPELAIDVQVTETGTEIVIHNPVNTFYRTILRDTQHVLYGWLAPFKGLGISLMDYLQTTELAWKNLQGDIKSLVQPAVMANYYDNNIQIIAKGRADLIYDGYDIREKGYYDNNRELFVPLQGIYLWRTKSRWHA